jgi:hypothetical protein
VQPATAGEVAAAADQRNALPEAVGLPAPVADIRSFVDDVPLQFLMQDDRHAAQSLAPLVHGGEEMRVRDGDGAKAPQRLDPGHRLVGDQRRAVPHHPAAGLGDDQRALADGNAGGRTNAEEVRLELADVAPVAGAELVEGRPFLAARRQVLPLVFADRAMRRRRAGRRETGAAGGAEIGLHGILRVE